MCILCVDLTKSAENSTTRVLVVVLACTLVFFTVTTATMLVIICSVCKKKSKRKKNLQEHVYESVSLPPTTCITLSEPAAVKIGEVTTSGSTNTKFELTDNEAYSSSKPLSTAETVPGTDPESAVDCS